jgi:hypothetical protein
MYYKYILALFICLVCLNMNAQDDKIIYLFLEYSDGAIVLNSYKVVDGKYRNNLRPIEEQGRNISMMSCKFTDKDMKSVYEMTIADPGIKTIEYIDEDGNIKTHSEPCDQQEFVIRMPYSNQLNRAEIKFERKSGSDNNTQLKSTEASKAIILQLPEFIEN